MKFSRTALRATIGASLVAAACAAGAQTIRVANQGDALSMDPYS